ncbi:MAG: hypothetical protein R2744_13310 [Bacteroidales bacterium]
MMPISTWDFIVWPSFHTGGANYKSFAGQSGTACSYCRLYPTPILHTSGSDGKVMKWSLDRDWESEIFRG